MRIILTFCVILLLSLTPISAQTESTDSIADQQLGEVVVEAPRVIHKADMDIFHPSVSALENSRNGMQLLRNLMIPSIVVDDVLGNVTMGGQNVQVRINGREATVNQVKALLPESIRRVEWIQNPGLRYRDATAVLNFIVVNPTLGGSVMADVMPALNVAWGEYSADSKLNIGRSQWSVNALFKLTNRIRTHREYQETFTFPDGNFLTRKEESLGGSLSNTFGNLSASYSYIIPDTTVVYASLYAQRNFNNLIDYLGDLSLSDGSDDILLHDRRDNRGTTPGFSAYLEQHFPRSQVLVVDFSGNLYNGFTSSDYREQSYGSADYITDVSTYIKDRNRAFGVEADYIKSFENGRLTAGASYKANRNKSEYVNLNGSVFHQRQDKTYLFTEYMHRIGKVTLTGGVGVLFTSFRFRESGLGSKSWNFRPKLSLRYRLNRSSQFRLNFSTWQTTPSLAQTNDVPQQIDGFQWSVGNPNLRTSNNYYLGLNYYFTLPRVEGVFTIMGYDGPNAITRTLFWEGDRLVNSYENSKGAQSLSFSLSPQITVLPGKLIVSGTLEYRMQRSRGSGYRLSNHGWSGDITAQAIHKGFVLMVIYRKSAEDLTGEQISWPESLSVAMLSYNWRRWAFSAGMIMPFGRYDAGSRMLSKWNTNETHNRLDMRIPFIKLNYNFQWGRQKRGANKIIDADSGVDRSSAAGR